MAPHVSDLDIHRTAHLWLERHGDGAVAEARKMAARFRDRGDDAGADTWLRVIVALTTLRQGPVGAPS